MMNPAQMAGFLKGRNPQEMVMTMLQGNEEFNSNPILNKLITYAQSGDINSLTKTAESIFQQNGKDFNSEFSNFMALINGK